jgi:acyl dehydratase
VRGDAAVEYTKPATKIAGTEVVTVIMVKNVSAAPIAGFKLEESWIDKAGTLSGGDTYRHPKPFMPGEVITVTLRTPRNARMTSNSYKFSHANGDVRPKVVPKLAPPTT